MSVILSPRLKGDALKAIVDAIAGGNATLVIGTANMAAILVTFTLAAKPATVSDGVLSFVTSGLTANASAGGTAASAVIKRSDGVAVVRGLTVGTTGTDIIISSTTITSGNAYSVTSATISDSSVATPPTIYYFDATAGNNANDGLSTGAPKQTLAHLNTLTLKYGDVIRLKRGESWNEQLNLGLDAAHAAADAVTIEPYGTGANPKIDRVTRTANNHGIVVYKADVLIREIDFANCANGIFVYGNAGSNPNASASIIKCNITGCIAGIVAGAGTAGGTTNVDKGGRLILVDGCSISGSTGTTNSDGIQISEDASAGVHTIINTNSFSNAYTGLNHKCGTAIIRNCKLYSNGQCGMLSQVHAAFTFFEDNEVYGNNTSNAGVFNMALENAVTFYSARNIYRDPVGGSNYVINVNISGGGSGIAGNPKFYSVSDVFIANNVTQFLSHINTAQSSVVDVIDIRHASFFDNSTADSIASRCIDGRLMSAKVHLLIQNCAFYLTTAIAMAYRRASAPGSRINGNCYYRSDSSTAAVIQIYNDDSATAPTLNTSYNVTQLTTLRSTEGTDAASIMSTTSNPLFNGPTAATPDFRLQTGSPCLSAGLKTLLSDYRDNRGYAYPKPFAPTAPNIGASALAGI